ncbi:hypothetical protein Droror1_Dr00022383 [Drosera rotundifolia]
MLSFALLLLVWYAVYNRQMAQYYMVCTVMWCTWPSTIRVAAVYDLITFPRKANVILFLLIPVNVILLLDCSSRASSVPQQTLCKDTSFIHGQDIKLLELTRDAGKAFNM